MSNLVKKSLVGLLTVAALVISVPALAATSTGGYFYSPYSDYGYNKAAYRSYDYYNPSYAYDYNKYASSYSNYYNTYSDYTRLRYAPGYTYYNWYDQIDLPRATRNTSVDSPHYDPYDYWFHKERDKKGDYTYIEYAPDSYVRSDFYNTFYASYTNSMSPYERYHYNDYNPNNNKYNGRKSYFTPDNYYQAVYAPSGKYRYFVH